MYLLHIYQSRDLPLEAAAGLYLRPRAAAGGQTVSTGASDYFW